MVLLILKLLILEVVLVLVGDDKLLFVCVEVVVDVCGLGDGVWREWDFLRFDDVVFFFVVELGDLFFNGEVLEVELNGVIVV